MSALIQEFDARHSGVNSADGAAISDDKTGGKVRRIVHVLSSVNPDSGGPATVVVRLAASQAVLGHQVSIISTLCADAQKAFDESTAKVPGFDRVHLLLTPWTTATQQWFGARLMSIFRTAFENADILHIHGIWEPMLIIAAAAARRQGVPYVVRPCGMLDPWNLAHRAWKKKIALTVTHRKMLNEANFIHTLNRDEYRLIEPLHLHPPQVIIPNGVFLDEVDDANARQAFSAVCPDMDGKQFVLFLGRLHYKKGLDVLLDMFAKIAPIHPDLHLLVIGPDGGAREGLLSGADKHGLAERIHAPGPLYGAAKFGAYRSAVCFCLPSRQEGFSLSITEALATGTPAAISEGCHFPEVASHGAGEVFPLNAEAAAGAVHRILSATPARRQMMGIAGRSLVERFFTWGRIAELTLNLYGSILANRKPATREN